MTNDDEKELFAAGWLACTNAVFSPDTSIPQTLELAWAAHQRGSAPPLARSQAEHITCRPRERWCLHGHWTYCPRRTAAT